MECSFFSLFCESLVPGLAEKRTAVLFVLFIVGVIGVVTSTCIDPRDMRVAHISALIVLCIHLSH